jgi:Serpin (serine protease inhibitor)
MRPKRVQFIVSVLVAVTSTLPALGHRKQQAEPANFLRSDNHIGLALLEAAHRSAPNRNVIVDAISVSVGLSIFSDYHFIDEKAHNELEQLTGWNQNIRVYAAVRMLLAQFKTEEKWEFPRVKDEPLPPILEDEAKADAPELSLSAALLHRSTTPFGYRFGYAARQLGFSSAAVSGTASQQEVLTANWPSSTPLPDLAGRGEGDFWIVAATKLRTTWEGNTFVLAKVQKGDFRVSPDRSVSIDVLPSELGYYDYAKTDEFEAVEIPGWLASVEFVLPSKTATVQQLEKELATDASYVERRLNSREGQLYLTPFHFKYATDIKSALQQLGVRRLFGSRALHLTDYGANDLGAQLTAIEQSSDVTIDRIGIKVDSGTAYAGVYGGIVGKSGQPFQMHLDRPFIFLIRDTVTGALLYAGAVVDPTQEPQPSSKLGSE